MIFWRYLWKIRNLSTSTKWLLIKAATASSGVLWETRSTLKCLEGPTFLKDIDFNSQPLHKILFSDFFPSITGHALLVDKYLSDPRAPFYTTIANEKIVFHDAKDSDPDLLVTQCYLLLLAAVWGKVMLVLKTFGRMVNLTAITIMPILTNMYQ